MTLLYLVIILVLAIVLARQASVSRNTTDYRSMSYRQGYWDGVRAAEQERGAAEPVTSPPSDPSDAWGSVDDTGFTPEGAGRIEDGFREMLPYTVPQASSVQQNVGQPLAPIVDSEEAAQARRNRNYRHTINIALYVASLLLVSGIILFAQTIGLSNEAKFAIVWLLIFVFYVAGFVINRRVPILKPAAVAFIGTALAAVPVAGITMYYLVTRDAATCWLVTSLIGSVMYVYATVSTKSQLLAYVSVISLFIFSCTLPAVANAQIMWYYIVIIAFGSLLTLLAHYKFMWIPGVFADPITRTSPIAVPVALAGAVVSFWGMAPMDYAAVFGASALYYATQAFIAGLPMRRVVYWVAARCLLMATVVALVAAMSESSVVLMSYALAFAGLINAALSMAIVRPRERRAVSQHEIMLWVGLGAAFIATTLVSDVSQPTNALVMTIQYVAIAVVALYGTLRLRRIEVAVPFLISLTVLPVLVGQFVAVPPVAVEELFVVYLVFITAGFGIRALRQNVRGAEAAIIYTFIGVWLLMTGGMALSLNALFAALWWVMLALKCYFVAANERVVWSIILGNASMLAATASIGSYLGWETVTTVLVLTAVNTFMTIGGSEWARRGKEMGLRVSRMVQVGGVVIGGFLGLLGVTMIGDEKLKAAAWMALVGVAYYVAWRRRSVGMLVAGNAAMVAEYWLIAVMAGLTFVESTALVAWLSLLGFAGLSEVFRSLGLYRRTINSLWQSGVMAAACFGVFGLLLGGGVDADAAPKVAVWLAATLALYYAVYRSGAKRLLYGANGALVVLVGIVGDWADLTFAQTVVCMAWLGLLGFYGAGRLHRSLSKDEAIWNVMFLSAAIATTFMGVIGLFAGSQTDTAAAGVALLGIGAALCRDDSEKGWLRLTDIGVVVGMLGFQRMLGVYFPNIHGLVYTHLWAMAALALAYLYRTWIESRQKAHARLVVGLLLLSVPTFMSALAGGGGSQLVFLVEHVVLVIIGLMYAYRLATWWGAVGVTLAVLYMLKGYTSLLTIAIGLIVIGAVAYVIMKPGDKRLPPDA